MSDSIRNYCITSGTIIDDYMWFCSAWYNFLFKFNMVTHEIEDVFRLPIGTNGRPSSIAYMYSDCHVVYMVTNDNPNKLIKCDTSLNYMELINISLGNNIWGNYSDEDKEFVFLPSVEKKQIVCIRKKDFSVETHQIECGGKGIQIIKKKSDGFVILETGVGDVVVLNKDYQLQKRISKKPNGFKIAYNKYYPGIGIAYIDNEVIVFPRYSNMIFSVNLSTQEVRQRGEIINNYYSSGEGPNYSYVLQLEDYIWLYSNRDNEWIIYNKKLDEIERIHMRLSQKVRDVLNNINLLEGIEHVSQIFTESKQIYTLENYIRSIGICE